MGGNPAYCQDLGDGVHGGLYIFPFMRMGKAGMGAQGANNLNALNLAKPKIAPALKLPPQRAAVQRGSRPCQALNVATKGKHVPQRILPEPMAAVKAPTLPDLKLPPQRAAAQQRSTLPKAGDSKPSQGPDAVKAKSRVKPINDRKPINSDYANSVYPLEKLPESLRKKYPHSVPFTGTGHPDFSRYAVKKVKINVTGNNNIDKKLANQAVGYKKTPEGFTWHHHHDGSSMYLVPKDLHDVVNHTGGAAIARSKLK